MVYTISGNVTLINGREICLEILKTWKYCLTLNETQKLESERLFWGKMVYFLLILMLFPDISFGCCQRELPRYLGCSLPLCVFLVLCSGANSLPGAAVGFQSPFGKTSWVLACVAFPAEAAGMIQALLTDNESQHRSPSPKHCSHLGDLNAGMILLALNGAEKYLYFCSAAAISRVGTREGTPLMLQLAHEPCNPSLPPSPRPGRSLQHSTISKKSNQLCNFWWFPGKFKVKLWSASL